MNTPSEISWESFRIGQKQRISFQEISSQLTKFEYDNIGRSQVVEAGQFSFRGGLLDIWLERYKVPVRLDLIGEKVESIYLFNPLTYEKMRDLKEVFIIPFRSLPNLDKLWKKRASGESERIFLSEIKKNDFVVHIDNGIGQFVGFETRQLGTGEKVENLVVNYAKGDKLYVPVNQIERLTRYVGIANRKPSLNNLGTGAWERTKQKVTDSVINVAKELLNLYALRETVQRLPYQADSVWQRQLEDSFEFQETPDQVRSIDEIKKDLEGNRPMDRLLVGDVGFGKTEVAIRTAFKVIQGDRQVAVLVPTTILAEQHFHLFKDRFKDFPVRVEILSRFLNKDTQSKIISDVENGRVDVVIGTHRLLSRDVKFSNLGLAIIDEEHRFGVSQKEKFKQIRANVDVLSLSATPIPRSLQMALSKIHEISILSVPPVGRLPIETHVEEFSWEKAQVAIEDEISRNGQVFYLANRIATIAARAAKLKELLPGVKIEYAHGQMEEGQLAKIMDRFYSSETQVLVCTTIIGSGLDMPNVNTILIENSQKFGLADLYQLRGRVGRGERAAFAYLFYPQKYRPEGAAAERLLAISAASELGSGFKIASRDLEIRGAGNLLGTAQSGNIALVGFELYIQLLAQAVEQLRNS